MHHNKYFERCVLSFLSFIAAICIFWSPDANAAESFAWQTHPGFRSAPLSVPESGQVGFRRLSPEQTGIAFTNRLSDLKAAQNQIRLNGSGVAAGDVDGDGRCDLYFCGLESANALYRNLGDGRFEEITEQAGVGCPNQFSTGTALADLDGDRDLDLLVNALGGGTRCFMNNGAGRFEESTDSGLRRQFGSMSMALADIEGDGDLDLYVANYRTTTVRSTGLQMLLVNGKRMLKPEDRDQMYITSDGYLREYGEVDQLYLNRGDGHFEPVSWTDGRFRDARGNRLDQAPKDWGLSVMFHDINQDGAPDLYVCNDFWSPDRCWLNDGTGRFQAIPRKALANTSSFSMGVDFADINRDGWDDFIVLDMLSRHHQRRIRQTTMADHNPKPIGFLRERPQLKRNTLFLNRGDGTYAEIARYGKLHASDWSWCPVFLDVDLDGYEDLLVTTGFRFDTQDADAERRIQESGPLPRERVPYKLLMYPHLPQNNLAFHNQGDLTFEESGDAWGFDSHGISQGMCLADLDQDGDLDVAVNNDDAEAGIYMNESAARRIAVRLKGRPPNTHGIGARVQFHNPPHDQSREVISGGRYLSSDDPCYVFAVPALTPEATLTVHWRSGRTSVIQDVRANQIYEVFEPAEPDSESDSQLHPPRRPDNIPSQEEPPFFQDVSRQIPYAHMETAFDDFASQPLLPKRLSQLGPGISWFDVNGDGWDDLICPSGRKGRMAVFVNQQGNGFARTNHPALNHSVPGDQTTVLGWQKSPGESVLLAGSSNYEDSRKSGFAVLKYALTTKEPDEGVPAHTSSTGPLALSDIDADGDLDLFVGGRFVPGRYPQAASSHLYLNVEGGFESDTRNRKQFEEMGLVSGAVFSDVTGDGHADLILACEWGPIRIFENQEGRLIETTQQTILKHHTGWWQSVTTGDFDGDGRLDIAAGNWGSNLQFKPSSEFPLRLYYGDFDENGTMDMVEAYHDSQFQGMVPERAWVSLARGLPFVGHRFDSHQAYAEATVKTILGDRFQQARRLEVTTGESMVFLNRKDQWKAKPLPAEAQFSPVFGIAAGDLDGDGKEDLVLGQNFFATRPEDSPHDAGRGLWLRGEGDGTFAAAPGQASGIEIYGAQRGLALSDYDADGRTDVAVAQNSGDIKLYHNAGAKPGLRVRLRGPAGNPHGVGATMRLGYQDHVGPAREIRAGSGYWSQDGAVQVLGYSEPPKEIWVRWPGGRVTRKPVAPDSRGITVGLPE